MPPNLITDTHLGFPGGAEADVRIQAREVTADRDQKNRCASAPALRRKIYERWRPAFKRYGYPE